MKKSKMTCGQCVRYHPDIRQTHDGYVYVVRALGTLPSGQDVAWLRNKAGCVSVDACSHVEAINKEDIVI